MLVIWVTEVNSGPPACVLYYTYSVLYRRDLLSSKAEQTKTQALNVNCY